MAKEFCDVGKLKVIEAGHPSGFYVYGLLDKSNGEVFYVGKGKGGRWLHHYREKMGKGNQAKRRRAQATQPACVVYAEDLSEGEAFDLERRIISANWKSLTNLSHGGRSEKQQSMDEAAEILAKALPLDAWIAQKPRADADIELYALVVERLTHIAAHGEVRSWPIQK